MNDDASTPGPVGSPVDRGVRPWGWHAGNGTPAHPADRVAQWPAHNRERMTQPVYDQAELDAAVAAARERCAAECRAMYEALREASPLDGSRAAVAQELERRIRGA